MFTTLFHVYLEAFSVSFSIAIQRRYNWEVHHQKTVEDAWYSDQSKQPRNWVSLVCCVRMCYLYACMFRSFILQVTLSSPALFTKYEDIIARHFDCVIAFHLDIGWCAMLNGYHFNEIFLLLEFDGCHRWFGSFVGSALCAIDIFFAVK